MKRLRTIATATVIGCLATSLGASAFAQDGTPSASPTPLPTVEVTSQARMAAITLDSTGLPGEYVLQGEDFIGADAVATGDVTAANLTDAGFVTQYVSTYVNPDTEARITSYVSDWGSADGAKAGFDIIEDESKTHPDGSLTDADAGVGEAPGETTSGTYSTGGDAPQDVAVSDITFRVDRYLVGVSLETVDGTAPDEAMVKTMAATLEGRATAAVGGNNPDGANRQLASRTMSLDGVGGTPLQAGFLSKGEVEGLYGLQGSSLGELTGSWNQAVGLGKDASTPPYLGLAATEFSTAADARTTISQASELMPDLDQIAPIDGVTVKGADAVAAFQYVSPATSASSPDSVRLLAAVGTQLLVVDVQGVTDLAVGQQAVTAIAEAQIGCYSDTAPCTAPKLPDSLAG